MAIERLAWDSDFFGMPIGRADPATDIAATVAEAREQGLACVYLEVPRGPALEAAAASGFTVVEERVILARALPGSDVAAVPDVAVRRADRADAPALGPALDVLAPWSRFAEDPRFGAAAARRMYDRWLALALAGDDEVAWLAEVEGVVAGCITVEQRGDEPEIGLLATTVPGRGAGRALIATAVRWSTELGAPKLLVQTQARNERALGFYVESGFIEISRRSVLHWWADV